MSYYFDTPKVVVFNMTPASGKDIAAEYLASIYDSQRLAFKDKLIELTQRFYNIDPEEWDARYTAVVGDYRMKEKPWKRLGGLSQREALIHVSENVVKPSLGKGFFGKEVGERLSHTKLNIISDGGFEEEMKCLYSEAEVLILQRDRLGNGWGSDSRGWVKEPNPYAYASIIKVPEEITEVDDYLQFVKTAVQERLRIHP